MATMQRNSSLHHIAIIYFFSISEERKSKLPNGYFLKSLSISEKNPGKQKTTFSFKDEVNISKNWKMVPETKKIHYRHLVHVEGNAHIHVALCSHCDPMNLVLTTVPVFMGVAHCA